MKRLLWGALGILLNRGAIYQIANLNGYRGQTIWQITPLLQYIHCE